MRCSALALEFLIVLFAVLVQHGFLARNFGEQYIGCYRDDGSNRAMGRTVITNTSVTVNMCLQFCRNTINTFVGVEYYYECYCADTFEKHGRTDNCNTTCIGNQLQICGGADALSVYTVCPRGNYGLNCNNKCYCNNHTVYGRQCFRNGTCPAGCQTGWTGTKCDRDINECSGTLRHHNCDHDCNNTAGSYTCSCWPGYTLNSDGRKCDDFNECVLDNGGCEQLCNNTPGSYHCGCHSGYTLDTTNNRKCHDIDECKESPDVCEHDCTNTLGSYTCSCRSGFQLAPNGRHCEDVDECTAKRHNCEQICNNTVGSFICSCKVGFVLDDKNNRTCTALAKEEANNVLLVISAGIPVLIGIIILSIFFIGLRRRRRSSVKHCKPLIAGRARGPVVIPNNGEIGNFDATRIISSRQSEQEALAAHAAQVSNASADVNQRPPSEQAPPPPPREGGVLDPIYANDDVYGDSVLGTRLPVTALASVVARIASIPESLRAEFQTLAMATDEQCDFAERPELKTKNRFKNILPYNKNRVQLSKLNGDPLTTYINASFIQGYSDDEKLIASHGPTNNTINDFWRMVWEYNVGVVVMVTKCHEETKIKCEQYWPQIAAMDFGEVRVEPHSVEERPDRIIRRLRVSKFGDHARMLTQIQFTDWPDHGVPEHAVSLLAIRHAVKRIVAHDEYTVVHCSAGVGRTGTYLAIDYLLSQAAEEGFVDVYSCVQFLREQRMHSVQTLDQYSFIFKAVREGLTLGETTTKLPDFLEHVPHLHETNPMTNISFVDTEFQLLQEMQPLPTEELCSDGLVDVNRAKNRTPYLLPMNSRRVYITQRTKGRTDYINAVFIPSFLRLHGFISTQLPLDKTVGDFWNMCVDHQCRLVVYLTSEESSQDVYGFLPASGDELQFGKTCVYDLNEVDDAELEGCRVMSVVAVRGERESQTDEENIYANTLPLKGKLNDGPRVSIIRVTVPRSPIAVRLLMMHIHSAISRVIDTTGPDDPAPVIVMSKDGVVHCGQFIAVCNLCDMINTQQEVDVFQTVYNIKRAQPHFYTNMIDYEELYKTTEAYIEQISIYHNS